MRATMRLHMQKIDTRLQCYEDCNCKHSTNAMRSSCRTSTTDVSNISCFAPAPLSSAACWNARPNLLAISSIIDADRSAHFLRTSPNSGAPVTPTTRYVPLSSFKDATTKGSALPALPVLAFFSAQRSREASMSHNARRDNVEG